MHIMAASKLQEIRQSLNISQEQLARRTKSVSFGTVRNAEIGRSVKYDTALQLLDTINSLLTESGREPMTLDDLELTIY